MRIKLVITIVLLLFTAASVVTAVAKEVERQADDTVLVTEPATGQGKLFTVYYFRNNIRCKSCKLIEAYTSTTVTGTFEEQIEDGLVSFEMVNTDEPEHKHFINEYLLYTKHVVLAEYVDGKQVRWKNLDRIWELLKDEEVFRTYIEVEIGNFLDSVPDEEVVWIEADEPGDGGE